MGKEDAAPANTTIKAPGPVWSVRTINLGGGRFRVLVCSGGGQDEVPNTIVSCWSPEQASVARSCCLCQLCKDLQLEEVQPLVT